MSGFKDAIDKWTGKTKKRLRFVFVNSIALAHESITEGSLLTGAPGQPVQTGQLKASWIVEATETKARITSNLRYARPIEDGQRNGKELTLRSSVGGFHSVKLTVAGWQRIVEYATSRARTEIP